MISNAAMNILVHLPYHIRAADSQRSPSFHLLFLMSFYPHMVHIPPAPLSSQMSGSHVMVLNMSQRFGKCDPQATYLPLS